MHSAEGEARREGVGDWLWLCARIDWAGLQYCVELRSEEEPDCQGMCDLRLAMPAGVPEVPGALSLATGSDPQLYYARSAYRCLVTSISKEHEERPQLRQCDELDKLSGAAGSWRPCQT